MLKFLATKSIPRLRLGVGPLPTGASSQNFVLKRFPPDASPVLMQISELAAQCCVAIVERGIDAAMTEFNGKKVIDNES